MESWKKGRRDLFEQLTKVYDQIGDNVAAELNDDDTVKISSEELRLLRKTSTKAEELADHNSRLVDELKGCREVALRVDQLEKENRSLAAQLENKIQKQSIVENPRPRAHPGSPLKSVSISSEPPSSAVPSGLNKSKTVTRDKYQALIEKYNKVCDTYLATKDANKTMQVLLDAEREKSRKWAAYSKSQDGIIARKEEKTKRLEEEIQRLKVQPHGRSNQILIEPYCEELEPCVLQNSNATNVLERSSANEDQIEKSRLEHATLSVLEQLEDDSIGPNGELDLPNDLAGTSSDMGEVDIEGMTHHTSSTEEISDAISPTKQPDTENNIKDGPLTENNRTQNIPVVLSSRSVKKRKDRHESSQVVMTPNMKTELITSSPIGLAGFWSLDPSDSLDLDDIGEKVDTPRKRRRLLELSRKAISALSYTPQHTGHIGTRQGHSEPNDAEWSREGSLKEASSHSGDTALRPRDTNRQILPRTSNNKAPKKRRAVSDKAISDLVEDGELSAVTEYASVKNLPTISGPLYGLLTKPSSPKSVLNTSNSVSRLSLVRVTESTRLPNKAVFRDPSRPSSTCKLAGTSWGQAMVESTSHFGTPSREGRNHLRGATGLPVGPPSLFPDNKRLSRLSTEPNDQEMEPEPLRARPLDKLNVNDFRANPSYNQGYDYAFAEVVRGQAARQCLQGCTKPECCGHKFRAIAQIMDAGVHASSQEEADMLLEFMGDNAYRLRSMTKTEKEEVLLQARTRKLANMYGRHRNAYERRTSPPGFWRADFPTTQEESDDRQKAKEKERQVVEQRYNEAMRPGGAYIFRDE